MCKTIFQYIFKNNLKVVIYANDTSHQLIYTKFYFAQKQNIFRESLYNINIYKEIRNREICND